MSFPIARRLSVLAITSALVLPFAGAVNPLDDDAGSGGDAPDHAALALPIGDGAHTGTLTVGADTRDVYAVHVDRGDVLAVEFAGDARIGAVLTSPGGDVSLALNPGDALNVPTFEGGAWVLTVEVFPADAWPPWSTLEYALSVRVTDAPYFATHDGTGSGWSVVEVRWDEPASFTLLDRAVIEAEGTDAMSRGSLLEYDLRFPGGRAALLHASHGGASGVTRHVRVSDVSDATLELPAAPGSFSSGSKTFLWSLENVTGSMRFLHYGSTPIASGVFALASDERFEWSAMTGMDVVTWRESDPAGEQVLLPGVSVTGPRDVELALNVSFLGFFTTHDASGAFTTPDGNVTTMGPGDFPLFLTFPQSGTWGFHLEETGGLHGQSDRVYLDGAFVPRMGVATFPWQDGHFTPR